MGLTISRFFQLCQSTKKLGRRRNHVCVWTEKLVIAAWLRRCFRSCRVACHQQAAEAFTDRRALCELVGLHGFLTRPDVAKEVDSKWNSNGRK